jgi:hypothetical protein
MNRPARDRGTTMVEVREITTSGTADLDLLRRFISDSFKLSFPGSDERDVEAYFHREQRGDFAPNRFHVIVATDGDDVVGGSVSAYIGEPNVGVIEYQIVNPSHRGSGVAAEIYLLSERVLEEDARRRGRDLDMFIAEIEDPFRTPLPTSFDRFRRAGILHYTGFRIADYLHVQRMLTEPGQEGLHTLLLLARPLVPQFDQAIPAGFIKKLLEEYFRFCQLDDPYYRAVLDRLEAKGDEPVELASLSDYVCNDESTAPVQIDEITSDDGTRMRAVIDEYTAAFTNTTAHISPDELRAALGPDALAHHVWSIRSRETETCEGIASFLAAESAGFAFYFGLTPPIRGRDVLIHLCSRVEKQMILDAPAAHGWYVQCVGDLQRDILVSPDVGFYELGVPFTDSAGEAAHLLYKAFGRVYEAPQLPVADFLTSTRQILTILEDSSGDRYSRLEDHVAGRDTVPLRSSPSRRSYSRAL